MKENKETELVYFFYNPSIGQPKRRGSYSLNGVRFEPGNNTITIDQYNCIKDVHIWKVYQRQNVITNVVVYSENKDKTPEEVSKLKSDEAIALVKRQTTIEGLEKIKQQEESTKARVTVLEAISMKLLQLSRA